MTNPFSNPDHPIDFGLYGRDVKIGSTGRKGVPIVPPQNGDALEGIVLGRNAEAFYNTNLPDALLAAQEHARKVNGYVAAMPQLLATRATMPFDNKIWTDWYTAMSEEDVGKTRGGNGVYLCVHGGGILSLPQRIQKAYDGELLNGAAKYSAQELHDALDGKFFDATGVSIMGYDDFARAKSLPLRYGVVLDFDEAKATVSGYQEIDALYENKLVHIRAGGLDAARAFLDKAKQMVGNDRKYGQRHPFGGVDIAQPQGRLLFADYNSNGGLNGYDDLNSIGRFVAVVGGAGGDAGARKK